MCANGSVPSIIFGPYGKFKRFSSESASKSNDKNQVVAMVKLFRLIGRSMHTDINTLI